MNKTDRGQSPARGPRSMATVLSVFAVVTIIMLVGCDGPTSPSKLRGGIVVTLDVVGERFRIWITNEAAITQAFALQGGTSSAGVPASIPVGRILRGSGQAQHNRPYRWHLDPNDIQFAQAAIEVCDGTPSFVEGNVDYFVDTVLRYCPWSARLVTIEDFRKE